MTKHQNYDLLWDSKWPGNWAKNCTLKSLAQWPKIWENHPNSLSFYLLFVIKDPFKKIETKNQISTSTTFWTICHISERSDEKWGRLFDLKKCWRTDRHTDGSASENLIDYVISRAKKYVYKVNKLLFLLQFFIVYILCFSSQPVEISIWCTACSSGSWLPLLWRHNGHDCIPNHQPHHCLLNCLFRRRSKKTSKLRVTGLCVGNSPVIGEFPAQMASNAENVSICTIDGAGQCIGIIPNLINVNILYFF